MLKLIAHDSWREAIRAAATADEELAMSISEAGLSLVDLGIELLEESEDESPEVPQAPSDDGTPSCNTSMTLGTVLPRAPSDDGTVYATFIDNTPEGQANGYEGGHHDVGTSDCSAMQIHRVGTELLALALGMSSWAVSMRKAGAEVPGISDEERKACEATLQIVDSRVRERLTSLAQFIGLGPAAIEVAVTEYMTLYAGWAQERIERQAAADRVDSQSLSLCRATLYRALPERTPLEIDAGWFKTAPRRPPVASIKGVWSPSGETCSSCGSLVIEPNGARLCHTKGWLRKAQRARYCCVTEKWYCGACKSSFLDMVSRENIAGFGEFVRYVQKGIDPEKGRESVWPPDPGYGGFFKDPILWRKILENGFPTRTSRFNSRPRMSSAGST